MRLGPVWLRLAADAEPLPQIDDRNDSSAKIYDPFDVAGRVGHGGDLRNADDFTNQQK